jgi:hypothetical protein
MVLGKIVAGLGRRSRTPAGAHGGLYTARPALAWYRKHFGRREAEYAS